LVHPVPDLHLSEEERTVPFVSGRYWVLMGGCKHDMTVKQWDYRAYQALIDQLLPEGVRFVQTGSSSDKNIQPDFNNVLNLVGQTSVRDLFRLIWHSDGVLCPMTSAMHIAAWAQKPCVVIAGGREAQSWEHYCDNPEYFGATKTKVTVPHRFLHTLGQLACAPTQGCDKLAVVKKRNTDRKICQQPILMPSGIHVARCMEMIKVDTVANAVMSYYRDGTLPAPGEGPKVKSYPKLSGLSRAAEKPAGFVEPALACPTDLQAKRARAKKPGKKGKPLGPVPYSAEILDDPILGGKVTIFVLTYGDYGALARRCLDSIIRTVPSTRLDLRVALNEPSRDNLEGVTSGQYPITKAYLNQENAMKYPVMRKMFRDPECPIETNYIIWFDDDSYAVKPDWLFDLGRRVVAHHPQNVRMYGHNMYHPLQVQNPRARGWFTSAPWHRGKGFRNRQRREAPNGNCIWFCVGGFWALETKAMMECDIPCERLYHNGGDITIGEQLWQGGYLMHNYNTKKEWIKTSGAARRGFSEKFQWYR
jgi:hypothetical protein